MDFTLRHIFRWTKTLKSMQVRQRKYTFEEFVFDGNATVGTVGVCVCANDTPEQSVPPSKWRAGRSFLATNSGINLQRRFVKNKCGPIRESTKFTSLKLLTDFRYYCYESRKLKNWENRNDEDYGSRNIDDVMNLIEIWRTQLYWNFSISLLCALFLY